MFFSEEWNFELFLVDVAKNIIEEFRFVELNIGWTKGIGIFSQNSEARSITKDFNDYIQKIVERDEIINNIK